jgi:hypothetical protein
MVSAAAAAAAAAAAVFCCLTVALAICNAGYASGSLSRTVPTSVCTADAATASGGRWGAVTGICTQVCLSPPPRFLKLFTFLGGGGGGQGFVG